MKLFKMIRASLRYSTAVKKADEAFEATGARQYVMPYEDGKLIIMDRRNFRTLKEKKYIRRDSYIANLERECFYSTPYKNGHKKLAPWVIDAKRQEYIKWAIE